MLQKDDTGENQKGKPVHPSGGRLLPQMRRGGEIHLGRRPERLREAGEGHPAFHPPEILLRGIPDVHAQVLRGAVLVQGAGGIHGHIDIGHFTQGV